MNDYYSPHPSVLHEERSRHDPQMPAHPAARGLRERQLSGLGRIVSKQGIDLSQVFGLFSSPYASCPSSSFSLPQGPHWPCCL